MSSGMTAAVQAILLQAQALNDISSSLAGATLPAPTPPPPFSVISMGTATISTFNSPTFVSNPLCTATSLVFLQAANAGAATLIPFVYVDTITNGSFAINHFGAVTGETFFYLIVDAT